MIALPCIEVVKAAGKLKGLIADFVGSRFELIELCLTLAGEFTLRSLAVQFGPRAIIKSGMDSPCIPALPAVPPARG